MFAIPPGFQRLIDAAQWVNGAVRAAPGAIGGVLQGAREAIGDEVQIARDGLVAIRDAAVAAPGAIRDAAVAAPAVIRSVAASAQNAFNQAVRPERSLAELQNPSAARAVMDGLRREVVDRLNYYEYQPSRRWDLNRRVPQQMTELHQRLERIENDSRAGRPIDVPYVRATIGELKRFINNHYRIIGRSLSAPEIDLYRAYKTTLSQALRAHAAQQVAAQAAAAAIDADDEHLAGPLGLLFEPEAPAAPAVPVEPPVQIPLASLGDIEENRRQRQALEGQYHGPFARADERGRAMIAEGLAQAQQAAQEVARNADERLRRVVQPIADLVGVEIPPMVEPAQPAPAVQAAAPAVPIAPQPAPAPADPAAEPDIPAPDAPAAAQAAAPAAQAPLAPGNAVLRQLFNGALSFINQNILNRSGPLAELGAGVMISTLTAALTAARERVADSPLAIAAIDRVLAAAREAQAQGLPAAPANAVPGAPAPAERLPPTPWERLSGVLSAALNEVNQNQWIVNNLVSLPQLFGQQPAQPADSSLRVFANAAEALNANARVNPGEVAPQNWQRETDTQVGILTQMSTRRATAEWLFSFFLGSTNQNDEFWRDLMSVEINGRREARSYDSFQQKLFEKIDQTNRAFIFKALAKFSYFFAYGIIQWFIGSCMKSFVQGSRDYIQENVPSRFAQLNALMIRGATDSCAVLNSAYRSIADNPNWSHSIRGMMEQRLNAPSSSEYWGRTPEQLYAQFGQASVNMFLPRVDVTTPISKWFESISISPASRLFFLNPIVRFALGIVSSVITGMLVIPQWMTNKLFAWGTNRLLARTNIIPNIAQSSFGAAARDMRGYSIMLTALNRQLEEVLEIIRRRNANPAQQANGLEAQSRGRQQEIDVLVASLFSLVRKGRCRTQDDLINLIRNPSLGDQAQDFLDRFVLNDAQNVVGGVLHSLIESFLDPEKLEQLQAQMFQLANSSFISEPETPEALAAKERQLNDTIQGILHYSVEDAVNKAWSDLSGQTHQREAREAVDNMKAFMNGLQTDLTLPLQQLDRANIVLSSEQRAQSIRGVSARLTEFLRSRQTAVDLCNRNNNFSLRTKQELERASLEMANRINPVAVAVGEMQRLQEDIALRDNVIIPKLVGNPQNRGVLLGLEHINTLIANPNFSLGDLDAAERELAVVEERLQELFTIGRLSPLVDQIRAQLPVVRQTIAGLKITRKSVGVAMLTNLHSMPEGTLFNRLLTLKNQELAQGRRPSSVIRSFESNMLNDIQQLPDAARQTELTLLLSRIVHAQTPADASEAARLFSNKIRQTYDEGQAQIAVARGQLAAQAGAVSALVRDSRENDPQAILDIQAQIEAKRVIVRDAIRDTAAWAQTIPYVSIIEVNFVDMQPLVDEIRLRVQGRLQNQVDSFRQVISEKFVISTFFNKLVAAPMIQQGLGNSVARA